MGKSHMIELHCNCIDFVMRDGITARKRSLGQVNMFTGVYRRSHVP